MLEFVKESKEVVIDCKNTIERELSELVPVKIDLEQEKYVLVDFDFVMSMVDGKVLNYITGTSSMQNCPICKATPNVMTSLEEFEKGYIPEIGTLIYGISPLHAWMRFFECLLHISYRMDFKKWQVSKILKEAYLKRKQLIQKRLYDSFGVRVDQPRQGGAGSSTTGNICRRAFSNPNLLSEALNVNEELIHRLWNILIAINCQEPINPEKLDSYCKATYRLYLQLYDWYKIPATVHKVLAHAGDIIIHSPAPLGMLAEEAAECQHKHLKKSRTHHARKASREENLHDVFIRAMNSSDPLISSLNLDSSTEKYTIADILIDLEEINDDFVEDVHVHNE
ncbi:uncharacterized protein LOC134210917 [Armigeres subalbatus]|uniref:uncharacterized protein LOC134210917 n=1 Tax=Armigeres subalbatus TaxID=124917 RepID=UPI002ED359F0